MRQELQKKVDRAIRFLRSIPNDEPIEIAYSGGKDSDVILELARMAGIKYRAIYKNTTIDPKGTIKHCKDMGVEIVRPKSTFLELMSMYGFPNRFSRFCCAYLKEYKILDKCIIVVRREESTKRAQRYKEPEICRVYNKSEKVRQYLPILDWTTDDVADFLQERGIKCAPVYYDEQGVFHPERRLGCMCCPLANTTERLQCFKNNPNMVKLYIRAGKKFMQRGTKIAKQHNGDVYSYFVREVFFFKDKEGWEAVNNGMFEKPDYKAFLEKYFNIKL